jgi:mono/diheme cytochrome c family protein
MSAIQRVFFASLLAVLCVVAPALSQSLPRVPLHRARSAASDLEIGGDLVGVARGETRFVRYADLLQLPQQHFIARGDSNFAGPVEISGIALERLPVLLGAARGALMVTALCDDNYKANYPAAYLNAHHPVLVLRINGRPPAGWPKSLDGPAMGPYMISHASFTPGFRVLSHEDEPQVPWGVVRLDFRRETEVYAGIQPMGPHARDEIVQQGFTIARQNCFRCHNEGAEGGLKARRSWEVVARRSVADPQYFNAYVHNPLKLNPASQMAASPGYDAATLAALRAYFQPFAEVYRP